MKFKKQYPIQIWFLDENPYESVKMLTNKLISKGIINCIQAIQSIFFYYNGIRNKKFYNFYFSKEKRQDTIDKIFQFWPMEKQPSFQQYDSKVSKWCRKSEQNFQYIKEYLSALCNEYEYRFKKQHYGIKYLGWLELNAKIPRLPRQKTNSIQLEWKSLDLKYRKRDICLGYRLKYKDFLENDGININDFTNRDIPSFLIENKELNKWMI